MTPADVHPRPAARRGGPWSPAVRRLLHEHHIDPRTIDLGPGRLSRRMVEALVGGPRVPVATGPATTVVSVDPGWSAQQREARLVRAVLDALPALGPPARVLVHRAGGYEPPGDVQPEGQPGIRWTLRLLIAVGPGPFDSPSPARGELVLALGGARLEVRPAGPALGLQPRACLALAADPALVPADRTLAALTAIAGRFDTGAEATTR